MGVGERGGMSRAARAASGSASGQVAGRLEQVLAVGAAAQLAQLAPPAAPEIGAIEKGPQPYASVQPPLEMPDGIGSFEVETGGYNVHVWFHIHRRPDRREATYFVALAKPADSTKEHPGLANSPSIYEQAWQTNKPTPDPSAYNEKTNLRPTHVPVKLPEELRKELRRALLNVPVQVVPDEEQRSGGGSPSERQTHRYAEVIVSTLRVPVYLPVRVWDIPHSSYSETDFVTLSLPRGR